MNVFIAGPRAITKLNATIQDRLHNIYTNNITVLVGDANGIDKSIQQYFHDLSYENVIVFASGSKFRNNVGAWKVNTIEVPKKAKGFEFYAEKDKAMAKNADHLNNLILLCSDETKMLYEKLLSKRASHDIQISLYDN